MGALLSQLGVVSTMKSQQCSLGKGPLLMSAVPPAFSGGWPAAGAESSLSIYLEATPSLAPPVPGDLNTCWMPGGCPSTLPQAPSPGSLNPW